MHYASLRVVRVKGVVFAESSRRGAKSIAKKLGRIEHVDHLGKMDNRRLRPVDARYQAPPPIPHADKCFCWSKEIADGQII